MKIEDLLTELDVPRAPEGHHHSRPGWLQTDCPFCSKGTGRWRLGINLYRGYCSCWACGPHSLVEVLADLTDLPFSKLKARLEDVAFARVPDEIPRTGKLTMPAGYGHMLKPHRKYLQHRGLDPDEMAEVWSLQGIGLSARMSWRIVIPVQLHGVTVSWTTRTIASDPQGLRYVSATARDEVMDHRKLLLGEDYCKHAVVVHEGPFDVFKTGPGAVCTFGTGFTRAQVLRLARFPVRAVCFDNDPEARLRAKKLVCDLTPFPGDTFLVTLDSKDAGSATGDEISELRKRFLT